MTLAHDYEEHGEPRLDAGSQQSATLLPRISIQAFCETRDVMEALEEARADRRASRTQMSVQMGGVAAAIDLYRESPTPDIVVLESMAGGQRLLDDLERLADVCDAETQVIIIGHANDVMLYRQLLARGVSEYLVAPVGPVDAIAAMCRLYAQEGEQHTGRSIAVIGAKGGVGASTVAHNFGWAMSQDMLKNVAIADLDLPFGTAGLDFNQDPSQGIADAIFAGDRLDESLIDKLLWKCTDRLSLFAAPATLDRDYDLEFEAVEPVIDLVRSLVPHIILDMPHQWNAWMRQTLMAADDTGKVYIAGHDIYAVDPETGETGVAIANASWDRPTYSGPDVLAFWPIGTQNDEFMLLYSAAVFTDEKQEELADFVWGYETVDLKTGATEIKDFASFEVIMFSAVRNPNALNELYGVYTQLSKHDVATGELVKRVDLPHTYYVINISSDGKEIYVGGTNDDIGVYDSTTLERIGEIRLPSGGDMSVSTLQIVQSE